MNMDRIVETVIADRTARETGIGGIDMLELPEAAPAMMHADDDTLADTWWAEVPMGSSYKDAAPTSNGNWVVGKQMTRAELVNHLVSHQTKGDSGAQPAQACQSRQSRSPAPPAD